MLRAFPAPVDLVLDQAAGGPGGVDLRLAEADPGVLDLLVGVDLGDPGDDLLRVARLSFRATPRDE